MRIGIDFDNTIAAYDHLFLSLAGERGYLPEGFSGGKARIRDLVRSLPDGETEWMRLQGQVYGPLMHRAKPLPGVIDFIRSCRNHSVDVFVVSHKTEYGHFDAGQVNLRDAARQWLGAHGFFDRDGTVLAPENVFFETTRSEKMARINSLGCTHFIDDLKEIFSETSFPDKVVRILLHMASGPLPEGPFRAFRNWRDISSFILSPIAVAEKLAGSPLSDIVAVGNGANSRVYMVRTENGRFAMKAYPRKDNDHRNRMDAEIKGLTFLRQHNVASVAEPLAAEPADGFALYSWIDGIAVNSPDTADIDAALVFLATLYDLRSERTAQDLGLASEACLSGAELSNQIYSRIARLQTVSGENAELATFVNKSLVPALENVLAMARRRAGNAGIDFDAELAPRHRTLSPSDFGFHNMLRRPDGCLAFLDFEYFGWDDPVKTVNDFVLHPGMSLNDKLKQRFVTGAGDIFSDDPEFSARLSILYPLYVLRWCAILLNEFLPEHWTRRTHAGAVDRNTVCRKQLDKSRLMLQHLTDA